MRVVSHESAATLWGMDVRRDHAQHVTVSRNHSRTRPPGLIVHRADLRADEVVDVDGTLVTCPVRTVLDCARTLPFGWGLAVADSALRRRLVSGAAIRAAAAGTRGPGATVLRQVVDLTDGRSGSCLESLTRALLLDGGLGPMTLQAALFRDGHAYDLSILGARTLIECDGAEHHRVHARFVQDCEDVTIAAREGYAVIRLTWYDVTRRPVWTLDAVRRTVTRQRARLAREKAAQRSRSRRAHRATSSP